MYTGMATEGMVGIADQETFLYSQDTGMANVKTFLYSEEEEDEEVDDDDAYSYDTDCTGHCFNTMKLCYQSVPFAVCCMCCAGLVLLCGVLVPGTVMWHAMNSGLEAEIEMSTKQVMGVQGDVQSAQMNVMNGKSTIENLMIHNPPNYPEVGPYFMTIGHINADVSWSALYKTGASLVDITHVTLIDMHIYIERNVNGSTNIGDIWNYALLHPLRSLTLDNKPRKYQIRTLYIPNLIVHVSLGLPGVPPTQLNMKPTEVHGVGVKEQGVTMETLIFLTTQSLFPKIAVKDLFAQLAAR